MKPEKTLHYDGMWNYYFKFDKKDIICQLKINKMKNETIITNLKFIYDSSFKVSEEFDNFKRNVTEYIINNEIDWLD